MVRRSVALALFVIAVAGAVPAGAGTVEPMKTGRADQFGPAADSDEWLGWTQFTSPLYTARAERFPVGGRSRTLRHRAGAHTFFGDIDPGTDTAIFQDAKGSNSNVYLADLATAGAPTSAPPAGINTPRWEWGPEISDAFILFGRNRFARPSSPWKVVLYDRTLRTFTVLDEVENRCGCIWPEDVNERYVAWTKCVARCNVFVYDTLDQSTRKVDNPDRQQYAASVSEEGLVYFVRSGNTCGGNAQIRVWDVMAGGTATTLVYDYPVGSNLAWALDVVDGVDGTHDVYFDRARCNDHDFKGDVLRIVDAFTELGPILRGPDADAAGAVSTGPWRGPHRPGARPIG
jgi:hypothetical protein